MFPFVCCVLFASALFGFVPLPTNRPDEVPGPFPVLRPVAGLAAAVVGAVLLRMRSRPGALRDWVQGGTVSIDEDGPSALRWSDWAIVTTRVGLLDRRTRRLHLERRVLLGLVPFGELDRPLADFYRVEVRADLVQRRHRGEVRDVRFDYAVALVDRTGARTVLLDVSGAIGDPAPERLVARLREALERDVGRPGGSGEAPIARLGRG